MWKRNANPEKEKKPLTGKNPKGFFLFLKPPKKGVSVWNRD